MSELRFDDRVAVVTGSGRGLGRAYALLLASCGASVVINDPGVSRNGEGSDAGPAEDVVEEISRAGGKAVASTDSVATAEGGERIVDTAIQAFGRIDILIHNATINHRAPLSDITWTQFSQVLDVHVGGAFHTVRAALPHMKAKRYGRIVLTSSIAGLYGDREVPAYCTAKAALIGLANAIALENAGDGITCNLIVPAAVTRLAEGRNTSSFPEMTPEQVAPMVAWLAHEQCSASSELLIALAGRMAKAYVAETTGVFKPHWTVEEVAAEYLRIGDKAGQQIFAPFPKGFHDHLGFSFAMARGG